MLNRLFGEHQEDVGFTSTNRSRFSVSPLMAVSNWLATSPSKLPLRLLKLAGASDSDRIDLPCAQSLAAWCPVQKSSQLLT